MSCASKLLAMFRVRFDNGWEKWANGYSEIPASAGRSTVAGMTSPGSTPAPRAGAQPLPAVVPARRYHCYLVGANTQSRGRIGGGVTEHQMIGYSADMGVLEVTGPTSYRWGTQTTGAQPGTFRYDRASGRTAFGSGPYKPGQFRGEFGWDVTYNGKPVITLYGRSEKHGELRQHCLPEGAD
jgi:hypothetical protein